MADNPSSNARPPSFSSPPPFNYKPGGFGTPLKPGAAAPMPAPIGSVPEGTGVKSGVVSAVGKTGPPAFAWQKPGTSQVAAENKPLPLVPNPVFLPEKPQLQPFAKPGPSGSSSREANSAAFPTAAAENPVEAPKAVLNRPPEFKGSAKPGPPSFLVANKGSAVSGSEEVRPKAGPQPFLPARLADPPRPVVCAVGKPPVRIEPSQPAVPSKFAPPVFGRASEQPPKEAFNDSAMEVTAALGDFGVPAKFEGPKFGPKVGLTPPPPVIISSQVQPAEPAKPEPKPTQAPPFKNGPWAVKSKPPGEVEEAKKPGQPEPGKLPFGGAKPWNAQPEQSSPPAETAVKPVGQTFGDNLPAMPAFLGKAGSVPFAKPALPPNFLAGKPPTEANAEQPKPMPPPTYSEPYQVEQENKGGPQLPPADPVSPADKKATGSGAKYVPPFPAGGLIPTIWRTGSLAYPVEASSNPLTVSKSISQAFPHMERAEEEKPPTPPQMPVPAVPQPVAKPASVPPGMFKPNFEAAKPSEPPKPVAATAPVSPPWAQKPVQPPFKTGLYGSKPFTPSENKPVEPSPVWTAEASTPPAAKPGPPAFLPKAADSNLAAQPMAAAPPAKVGPSQLPFRLSTNDEKPAVESFPAAAPLPFNKPGPIPAAVQPPFNKPGPIPITAPQPLNKPGPMAAKPGPPAFTPVKKPEDAKGMPAFMNVTSPIPSGPPFQPPSTYQAAPVPAPTGPMFPSKGPFAPFKPSTAPAGSTPPWQVSKSGLKVGTEVPLGQPINAVAKSGERPPSVSGLTPLPSKFGSQPYK